MSVLTAANQLTLLRLLLVPVFVICMLYGWPGWALLVFTLAGATDLLDGLIARWTGHQTALGAWLDPVADKVLLVTTFVMLTIPGLGFANRLPLWLTVLMISRDAGIVLTVAVVNLAVTRRTFKPTLLGKLATMIYVLTGVVTLYANYLGRELALVQVCVYAALVITLLSAAHYLLLMTRGESKLVS
jgi:cardiolipin synthase